MKNPDILIILLLLSGNLLTDARSVDSSGLFKDSEAITKSENEPISEISTDSPHADQQTIHRTGLRSVHLNWTTPFVIVWVILGTFFTFVFILAMFCCFPFACLPCLPCFFCFDIIS